MPKKKTLALFYNKHIQILELCLNVKVHNLPSVLNIVYYLKLFFFTIMNSFQGSL